MKRLNNKRGQIAFPIIAFIGVVGFLLLIGPVFMKVFLNIQSGFGNGLGNVSSGGQLAQTNFNAALNPLITFWDKILIIGFVVSVILLFISAFMIDTSPFWIFLYIIIAFMLVIFTPNIMSGIDNIYNSALFAQEMTYLPFLAWLENNFIYVLIGIIFVTGIIIYGKVGIMGRVNGGNRR